MNTAAILIRHTLAKIWKIINNAHNEGEKIGYELARKTLKKDNPKQKRA